MDVDETLSMATKRARYNLAETIQAVLEESDNSDFEVDSDESDNDFLPAADGTSSEEDHVSDNSTENEEFDHNDRPIQLAVAAPRGRGRGRGRRRGRGRGPGRGGRGLRDNPLANPDGAQMIGRNGRVWTADPAPQHRRRQQDIIRQQPGVSGEGRKDTIRDVMGLYLTEDILAIIVRETNREAARVHREWYEEHHAGQQKEWNPVTIEELMAFIGLLILAGVYHGNHEPLSELWSPKTGRPIFIATMSLKRFQAILRYLRFDNKNTRVERRATDKLAPIRDVWDMFVLQLRKFYIPGSDVTVDEQLVPFRGRCPFRQYIPSKPAKYGIKIWWACDATTSYPLNAAVYLGRQPGQQREVNQGANVVKSLIRPWYRSGRNVVGDNLFTSVPLVEELLTQGLTYVGTVRQNKPDLPPAVLAASRDAGTSMFGFSDQLTVVSYVPKKNKLVLLLSSMHHDGDLVQVGDIQKPEIIIHYNNTKSGVDNMDHLASVLTCRRKINRWPMTLFFNIIDVASIAAFVVWICNNPAWHSEAPRRRRRLFMVDLGHELVRPHILMRVQDQRKMRRPARAALKSLGFLQDIQRPLQPAGPSQGRCHICPRIIDRKGRKCCSDCHRFVCQDHSAASVICEECI